jgi:deoxyadenosine/deoxycytidine kinase
MSTDLQADQPLDLNRTNNLKSSDFEPKQHDDNIQPVHLINIERSVEQEKSGSKNKSTPDQPNEENKITLYLPMSDKRRKFTCIKGNVIVLEGPIGVGKSTLGKSLSMYLSRLGLPVKFFPEFVNNSLLELYLSDMKKYAYAFQVIIARERLQIYRDASNFSNTGGISIIDRSLIGDYTFALMQREKGYINDDEWAVYLNLIRHDPDCEPYVTLFLECDPKQAFSRMRKRNNSSEVKGYSIEYFEDLNNAYMKTIQSVQHEVNIVPWNSERVIDDSKLDDETCDEVLSLVRDIIIE